MKVLIPCNGSRGDIQPFVALACGLKSLSSDYEIILGGPEDYKEFVTNHGLEFFSIEPSIITAINETSEGKTLKQAGFLSLLPAFKAFIALVYESWYYYLSHIKI